MQAAIARRYGAPDVVQLREVPTPSPGAGEVLVRVRATSVTSGDARVRGFNMPRPVFWLPARAALGLFRPRRAILGTEFAGEVAELGAGVTRFQVGDAVFGMKSFGEPQGSHAEYLTIASDGLIEPKPSCMSFEEAGCVAFGLHTARHFLQKQAHIHAGQRIMIIGAAGAVGCAAVQLAKYAGAHVTAVCSTRNVELLESLGADRVLDRTKDAYTRPQSSERPYDVVLDAVGASSLSQCSSVLAQDGTFIAVVMGAREIVQALVQNRAGKRRIVIGVASESPADMTYFREMIEAGRYRSVIDRTFQFSQIADAHRYVDTWSKRGNVVVSLGQ